MQTTSLIGRRCKRSNTFSWPILIDRGLEPPKFSSNWKHPTIATVGYKQEFKRKVWVSSFWLRRLPFSIGKKRESVKSVILSQRVHLFPFRTQKLSSAEVKILVWRRTGKIAHCWHIVGAFTAEGPPVPIPNTEVKLCWGENTCLATDREDSSLPTLNS